MGQAQSLATIENHIQHSFSSRVLVSHGLFSSPTSGGSFVVCEVDDLAEEGHVKAIKFVIQVLKGDLGHPSVQDGERQPLICQAYTSHADNGVICSHEPADTVCESSFAPDYEIEAPISSILAALTANIHIQPASYAALINVLSCYNCHGFCESQSEASKPQNHQRDSQDSSLPGRSRHANVAPVLGVLKGLEVLFIIYPHAGYTLKDVLYFSPRALGGDDHIRLLVYGMLSGLAHCHALGIPHGNLEPSNILLTQSLWCWLSSPKCPRPISKQLSGPIPDSAPSYEDGVTLGPSDWRSAFGRWWRGDLSNYEYLLVVNTVAGRKWGDRCFHPVMPWVIDFCCLPDESSGPGWRDLSKSKWRLAKGDEQLDVTYATSDVPHHVSDESLSELAVCIYKARRLPLSVLRRTVRSVYEPNEYPVSMNRLYQWTPDECIPEFYSDPNIFSSLHAGMADLAVPSWAEGPEHFISLHRAALESNYVSSKLHHWIDLTFGYKLSGEAAFAAKNVLLSSTDPMIPRACGRRQVFSSPHPARQQHAGQLGSQPITSKSAAKMCLREESSPIVKTLDRTQCTEHPQTSGNDMGGISSELVNSHLSRFVSPLEEVECAVAFREAHRHLSPLYKPPAVNAERPMPSDYKCSLDFVESVLDYNTAQQEWNEDNSGLIEDPSFMNGARNLDVAGCNARTYEDATFFADTSATCSPQAFSDDIFAAGCIIAEIYLHTPLFNSVSAAAYAERGVIPELVEQLPLHVQHLVRAAINPDSSGRPTAARLLRSSFFPSAIQSAHSVLSSFQVLDTQSGYLEHATKLAEAEVFQLVGPRAVELLASPVLFVLSPPATNIDAMKVVTVLTSLLRALKLCTSVELLLPAIRQLLLSQDSLELKVALLQPPFVRELRKTVGSQSYLNYIHCAIMTNLQHSAERGSPAAAAAASTVLISMCQELGVPITIHQTVWPLLQCFGRDVTTEGIEVLVGIGKRLGEQAVVKHLLPPFLALVSTSAQSTMKEGHGQSQIWGPSAVLHAISAVDRLIVLLSPATLIAKFLRDLSSIYVQVLHGDTNLAQCAAKALLAICEHAGPDATVLYVLPHLRKVFEVVPIKTASMARDRVEQRGSLVESTVMESSFREDVSPSVLHILYPVLASRVGIERLRENLPSWAVIEQALLTNFNWQFGGEIVQTRRPASWPPAKHFSPYSDPANLLLDGVGWSIPQSIAGKAPRHTERTIRTGEVVSHDKEPWFWVPSHEDGSKVAEVLRKAGTGRGIFSPDKHFWELNVVAVHSWQAHSGVMRAIDVADDESTLLTAGKGTKGAAIVRQWKLATSECVLEYGSHDEALHDVCFLRGSDRIASCDGSLRIWDKHTAELIFCVSESAGSSPGVENSLPDTRMVGKGGSLPSSLTNHVAGLYTSMHYMPAEARMLTGTAEGLVRFIDLTVGQLLFSWRCLSLESPVAPVCSIASSGVQNSSFNTRSPDAPSWIAVADSIGNCRLLDHRCGSMLANWRAHDGVITKLQAVDGNYLLSSSMDRTISFWDLRRSSVPCQVQISSGHTEGVTSFALRGDDLLSASGNKIGVSPITKYHGPGVLHTPIQVKALSWAAHSSGWSRGKVAAMQVLPYSHYLLIGNEDGRLNVFS